jgi:hypothetical protein
LDVGLLVEELEGSEQEDEEPELEAVKRSPGLAQFLSVQPTPNCLGPLELMCTQVMGSCCVHADAVLHSLALLPLGGRGESALSRDNGVDWVLGGV